MPITSPRDASAGEPGRAVGVRAAYDAVAHAYHAQFADEFKHKPLDRALLEAFIELVGAGRM